MLYVLRYGEGMHVEDMLPNGAVPMGTLIGHPAMQKKRATVDDAIAVAHAAVDNSLGTHLFELSKDGAFIRAASGHRVRGVYSDAVPVMEGGAGMPKRAFMEVSYKKWCSIVDSKGLERRADYATIGLSIAPDAGRGAGILIEVNVPEWARGDAIVYVSHAHDRVLLRTDHVPLHCVESAVDLGRDNKVLWPLSSDSEPAAPAVTPTSHSSGPPGFDASAAKAFHRGGVRGGALPGVRQRTSVARTSCPAPVPEESAAPRRAEKTSVKGGSRRWADMADESDDEVEEVEEEKKPTWTATLGDSVGRVKAIVFNAVDNVLVTMDGELPVLPIKGLDAVPAHGATSSFAHDGSRYTVYQWHHSDATVGDGDTFVFTTENLEDVPTSVTTAVHAARAMLSVA